MKDKECKYGIIVCSDCKSPKTVLLKNETTECHQCGKRITISKMKLHFKTDSREEASWAVGRLNAKMEGGELPEDENEEENDPHVKASIEADVADDEREKLDIICRVLGGELGSFEIDDVQKVYELLDKEGIEDLEKKLKRSKEIYEKEEGVFCRV